MAIRKRILKSGVSWGYYFDLPGSTRAERKTVSEYGFSTKKEAAEAEAARRILEAKRAAEGDYAAVPRTLRDMLAEFFEQHCERNLGGKTTQRYREQAAYLAPELLDMQAAEISPVHLTREWNRLRESGGHFRGSNKPRPLSAKSVRNVAGVVSSAYRYCIGQGLKAINPVPGSAKPRNLEPKPAVALNPQQQRLMIDGGSHWIVPVILEICAGLGIRRGEALALRWADIHGDEIRVGRSLSQVKRTLNLKVPKTAAGYRIITIPRSTLLVLDQHRKNQAVYRGQFGPDYRTDLDLIVCQPNGDFLRPDSISGTISALARKLKLPKGTSLHTLRHSHGSQLLAAGMELPAVSARLGHSSTHVTARVYSHVLTGRDRAAADAWDEMQLASSRRQHHAETSAISTREGEANSIENKGPRPN